MSPRLSGAIRLALAAALLAAVLLAGVFATPYAPSVRAVTCPALAGFLETQATLWNSGLRESSGIQSSLDHPGVLWIIEDSYNGPYLYAYSLKGDKLASYTLKGSFTKNIDWEAIGLDHRGGADLLYIGDIGDNAGNRDGADRPLPALYRLAEPAVSANTSPPIVGTISSVQKFKFRYFDRTDASQLKPRDAEALFVDPRTSNIFVIWKTLRVVDGVPRISRVFQLKDRELRTGEVNHAVNIADPIGASDDVGTGPVAADISRDGNWIVVKNYEEGFLWPRGNAQTIHQALSSAPAAPCRVTVDGSESITFEYRDGRWAGVLSLKEDRGGDPPLRSVHRT